MEIARPDGKVGRSESLGPFEIGDLAAGGDQWAPDRWRECEAATEGRQKLRWSRRGGGHRLGTGDAIVDDTTRHGVVADLDKEESTLLSYIPPSHVRNGSESDARGRPVDETRWEGAA